MMKILWLSSAIAEQNINQELQEGWRWLIFAHLVKGHFNIAGNTKEFCPHKITFVLEK